MFQFSFFLIIQKRGKVKRHLKCIFFYFFFTCSILKPDYIICMCKVFFFICCTDTATIHSDSCLCIWFLGFQSDLHIPVCVVTLITNAYKLLYSQERNLQSAIQRKCKSCQDGSTLLRKTYWFLHYLCTEQCSHSAVKEEVWCLTMCALMPFSISS